MSSIRRSEEGFTITELVFTLTILGFLLTLAVPALSATGERIEKELFLDFFASDIQLAQLEAISRQEEVCVQIQSKRVRIMQADATLRETVIPQRYTLKSNYADGAIRFRKTGQVQGGTVWLYKGDHPVGQMKIQVSSGRTKVEMIAP